MKEKARAILANKDKPIPILSFPSTHLLRLTVTELIKDATNQAMGMKAIAERCNIGASLNMMDLSVEAEEFGAQIHFGDNEIPTVTKGVISSIEEAKNLRVPTVGGKRTGIYIEGVRKAKEIIDDIPVFCGVIGPFSLAGRLLDMTELMVACFESADEVKLLIGKCTEFITSYINGFKKAGADGVIMAEPLAGILSPVMCEEFSTPFVKLIKDAVSDDDFIFCYHNCGSSVIALADSLASINADMYHFGNAVDLSAIIPLMPRDSIVLGNIDPVLFKTATPGQIKEITGQIFSKCSRYDNFMLSSGCDIPAESKWENIDAFFETVKELYK